MKRYKGVAYIGGNGMYKKYIKRAIDILISFCAIVILSPLFFILIILGAIFMKGNPFFVQKRPGKNEVVFKMIKFRTMNNNRDNNGNLLPDSVRLNKYGRFLRKTSLDEITELLNILKGDMSIVGPRPLSVMYLPYYTDDERIRHTVLPGLTGLAQINGRNTTTWEERFAYDAQYARHVSFMLDIKIIIKTVIVVIRHTGIGERGVDSLEDFDVYREKMKV